jgi:diguanylate cyclase (GGDEF)-like protein/PAS domain S-box-containing protein
MSFRTKLFYIFLFYGLLLAVAAELFMVKINKDVVRKDSLKKAALYAEALREDFQQNINNARAKLEALRQSKILRENFEKNRVTEYSKELFLDIARTSPNIMQLRFINLDGDEAIRINRISLHQEAYIQKKSHLQNKAKRYYFKDILRLKDGEFWYSKVDLNVEHGKIQIPIHPVFRIGTPYYYKGKKEGVLILNIFMQSFLDSLVRSDIYSIYLLDHENYILVDSAHKNEWSRYLVNKESSPQLSLKHLEKLGAYKLDLKIGNKEGLKVLIIPRKKYIVTQVEDNFYQFFWVVFAVVLLSFPLAYLMSIVPSKLNSKVNELNEKLTEEANKKTLLLSLFDLSDAVLFKWNCDEKWSVSYVSNSVEKLLGYTPEDFIHNRVAYLHCIYHDDLERVEEELKSAIVSKSYFLTHKPYRIVTKDRKIKWILVHTVIIRNELDEVINFVGYLNDITQMKQKEFALENLARVDQLTQINNRLYLDEVLMSQYYRFNRYAEESTLILIDIDYFKSVNDEYGHIVGDKILIEFAEILKRSIRKDDILGRWGGEEFLIILPHTDIERGSILAEKLRKIIEAHSFKIVGKKSASFGVSTFVVGMSVEQCVDMADQALYKAKKAGRNIVKRAEIKASIKKK